MEAMVSSELLSRLSVVRTRVRRRLIAYGIFAVCGGGAVAFLTAIALDWFLWLPPALRAIGAGLFFAGFFGAAYYWIITPLRARLDLDEIAGRLEQHFSPLRDRLSSSVNFLGGAEGASPDMVREVIRGTEEMVRDLPLETALSIEPVAFRGSIFGVSMVLLLFLFVVAPTWIQTGVRRYAAPWGRTEWPRSVLIVPITSDQAVPLGESANVAMRVERGLGHSLRGVVHLRSPDGSIQTLAMQRDAGGGFFATLDAVTEDIDYWFEAGDDSTERYSSRITVVHRPEVVEALAIIEPPPYAKNAPVRTEDLTQGPAGATIGGFVTVAIRSSKPISAPAQGGVGLQLSDDSMIPLTPAGDSPEQLSARLQVLQDTEFRVELRDEFGLRNHGPASFRIAASPDSPPSATILRPPAMVDITPRGIVQLEVRVDDDYGIAGLELRSRQTNRSAVSVVPLLQQLRVQAAADGVTGLATHAWSMEAMNSPPGAMITYEVVVEDTFTSDSTGGQIGASSPQQIRIISETEFELRVREDVAALESRIRQAALEQEELRDRTDALARSVKPASQGTESGLIGSFSSGQARLGRHVRELAARFDQLAERVAQNQAGDEAAGERMMETAESLRRTASESMGSAEALLSAAREQAESGGHRTELEQAAGAQTAAADELRSLLRTVSQWGTFQGLVSRTRDLLDRQTRLQRETSQIGQTTLGKSAGSLTDQEADRLNRAQRQQEQLAADVDQHLARMRELAEAARGKQPAAADAVDAAIRAARANQIDKRLRGAAEAIRDNRTAAANMEQRAAAEAMRSMVAALREREKRELEELRKRLHSAEEQVAWLIEHQQTLFSATTEAGMVGAERSTFESLEQEQRTLGRNTMMTGEDLVEIERASSAARLVRQAAGPMDRAALRLAESLAESAAGSQQEALDLLRQAQADLQAAENAAAEQAQRHSLDRIHDGLEAILNAQLDINEGVAGLEAEVRIRQSIGRVEARLASKLARQQIDARAMIAGILEDLQQVPVYEWALQRAGGWMDESRDALENRRIDAELVALTDRIAKELQKLIAAIDDTIALPMDIEFAEAEPTAGSSPGESAAGPPVPTIAELMVLKSMQLDINQRTAEFAETFNADTAREDELRRLTVIAEDQAEVRRLTELVTKKAREGT